MKSPIHPLRFSMAALILSSVFFAMGCQDNSRSDRDLIDVAPTPHQVLSCDSANAEYFEPLLGECRIVDAPDDAYILDRYRYVSELVVENPDRINEYRVLFRAYLSLKDASDILTDLSPGTLSSVSFYFSDVDGGLKLYGSPAINEQSVDDQLRSALMASLDSRSPRTSALREELEHAVENGDVRIWQVHLQSRPVEIKRLWDGHFDMIRLVQPLIRNVDLLQMDYCPDCPFP